MSFKIMVVDDEKNILELITYNLKREGYVVFTAENGLDALKMATEVKPDLVLLDIMLPGKDGLEVCQQLRYNHETADVPIIMLSAKDEEIDKVVGLEVGADDYVTKPFSPRELLARIKVNLRRISQTKTRTVTQRKTPEIIHGNLVIKPESFEVYLDKKRIDLSPKEFEILCLLAANPGRVFTRDVLLEKIWGFDSVRETRTVDVHIRYLRQKIEPDPTEPKYIETIRGVGYRFKDN